MVDLATYFAGGFERKKAKPQFLTNLCKEVPTKKAKIKLDQRVIKSICSVNIPQCSGGRFHDLTGYNEVEYKIPKYNDYTALTEDWFLERPFGAVPYGEIVADAVSEVSKNQGLFSLYQANSKSKQVADGLLNGAITLINGDKIEFNKRETHDIKVSKKFTDNTAKILDELSLGCQLICEDGMVSTNEFHFITNGASTNSIITNDQVQKAAKKTDGIDRVAIGMPVEQTPGVSLSGIVACDGFTVYIWSYKGSFTVPEVEDYKFANAGMTEYFIPNDRGILLPKDADLSMFYGGIVTCPNMNSGAVDGVFKTVEVIEATEYAYSYPKTSGGSTTIEYGVKSAPLFVPTNPDGYVSFSNLV